jgi:regulation of enolase protein 1 (concanavalin A-like superfamily)
MKNKMSIIFAAIMVLLTSSLTAQNVAIEGNLKRWHKVTLKLTGPSSSEQNSNNPFLNYRFNVTFTHPATGTTYKVPGYFAADGNAGNTSATSGNKWKAHLSPDHTGTWNYSISFRQGNNVAVASSSTAGSAMSPYNGINGSFNISETDKEGRDFRAKDNGRLKYVGQRYLKYSGSNRYFLKQGPDAPENLLNYADFDGMFNNSRLKTWSAHLSDWKSGDPTWKNGKGKALIGAVNYLASEGLNVFSFLTMNVGGDDNNAYPYVIKNNQTGSVSGASKTAYINTLKPVMDCSKLDQWEVLFTHATSKGMYLHFKTQETENDQYLDGGSLGNQRKLYYRELIARFGHNLALNWNLGEETTNSIDELKSFAQYFYDNDPYRHNVVLHTYPGDKDKKYGPLVGSASKLTGLSMQTSNSAFGQEHGDVLKWVNESTNAGRPWVVAVDEPGDASASLRPDNNAGNSHTDARKKALWGTFMAGGAGNEWYFGYKYAHSDLTCEDFRSRDKFWDYARYSLQFFNNNNVPFATMANQNGLIGNGGNDNSKGYCLAKAGAHYVIYLPSGGSKNLNLNSVSGSYSVKWYDPRNGGGLQNGTVTTVNGGGNRSIGNAPSSTGSDWVVYVVNKELELAAGTYLENNGQLIMEMENTSSDLGLWVKKTNIGGHTGSGYLEFTGNNVQSGSPKSPLEFNFKIEKAGLYYLHLHCARENVVINGENRTDVANDAFVRVEGDYSAGPNPGNNHGDDAPLSVLKTDTKFFGGNHNKFVWASGNRLDLGGHNNKRVAVYNFKAGETYKLVVQGRSKLFKVNRILFRHKDVSASVAQNVNLPESERGNTNPDPEPDPDPDPNPGSVYDALTNFGNTNSGEVPYYNDTANNVLAIDASNVNYRNKFAQAETTFNGEDGTYSVKITTMTEEDGESTYRLHVNSSIVKTFKNPYIGPGSSRDRTTHTHTWTGISLNNGDKIAVSSNTHTNGEIAEGAGTAWSRGRWRSVEFIKTGTPDPEPDPEPDPDPDPDPKGTLAITDDAYLEKSSRKNDSHLKVEAGNRVSYLKIDVKDADKIEAATLNLTVNGDPGNGTIRLYAGSHSNWTEGNLSTSNAPSKGIQLSSANKSFANGSKHNFDITKLITGNGAKTIIIEMDAGGNDVWFSSSEGSAKPVVNITLKPEPVITVTMINLINASSDTVVKKLITNDVVNKATLPSFTLQAITSGSIGSVVFFLNNSKYHTENVDPYSISGDDGGDFNPWDLAPGDYTVKATAYSGSNGSGTAGDSVTVSFKVVLNSLPNGQSSANIGNTGFNTLVTHANGTYLISASGADIWGKADSFGFVHQNASGDVELTAKIESIGNTNIWAKAGVMIRESLDADSKHAMTVITPSKGASFQRRTATGQNSGHTTIGGVKAPQWVKVLRTGNRFTGYYSSNNDIWYPMGGVNITMSDATKVGLAVTSHDNTKETEAMISNFSVRKPSGNLAVIRFFLVNADTDEDIRELFHNSTINLAKDGKNLNIRAETTGVEESVVFHVNGTKFHTENVPVYAIGGNNGDDYKPWTPALGSLSIMATPHSEKSGGGSMGTSLAVIVNVIDAP